MTPRRTPLAALLLAAVIAWGSTGVAHAAAPAWIVGGARAPITEAPWQVDVWSENGRTGVDCGGAILDARTVLTAAHCVDGTRPGAPPRSGGLAVWAGTSSILAKTATIDDRLALQERRVASARVHPLWRSRVTTTGDLAVLTLAEPLVLDGRRVAAIGLPPELPVPQLGPFAIPGTLTVTGYGITRGGGRTDGRLRSIDVRVLDPDRCDDADNAIAICAAASRGSACSGDSGGPVTAAGIFLVGIVSNGPRACPAGGANRYVNLYAPENRAFVLGATAPPVAPRRTAKARFTGGSGEAPRLGDTLTCDGGAFTGVGEQRTVIRALDGSGSITVSGRTASLPLTVNVLGTRLSCRSYASGPGGASVSNAVVTEAAVRTSAPPPNVCPATPEPAAVTVRAPASARPGAMVSITARVQAPGDAARAALLVVKRAAAGAPITRATARVAAGAPEARVTVRVRVPRSARAGQRLTFQVVLATYPSRAAARGARGTAGACATGETRFGVRVRRGVAPAPRT